MSDNGTKPDGTQAIRRAASILRHIARGPKTGLTLREISEAMELTRSTAHRILKCLLDEDMVVHVPGTRRYLIGSLTFELGLAATFRHAEVMQWRPSVEALSRQTGATSYLMGRSGNEAVCLCKSEGMAVVRVIPVEVGQRRPIGVGAGAIALLAATTDGDLDNALEAVAPYLQPYPAITPQSIRLSVDKARKSGFAESRGAVVEGVYGLGVAIQKGDGPATLALSLAAHQSFATPEAIEMWKRSILKLVNEQP